MKNFSLVLGTCFAFAVTPMTLSAQGTPAPAAAPVPDTTQSGGSQGVPNAFRKLDDRALPFLSRWTVCEAQIQKLIQQFFKNNNRDPGQDLAKISIYGEPKKNGKYEIYQINCGSASIGKKEIDELMLQGMKDLISAPVGAEGEESYCHDFTSVSAVGGKVSTEIEKKVGIGENNFRMPTGGRQYISLSLFEQFIRVGATNWWIQNIIGNDPSGYMFWNAGEAKILARRPLIDNYDNNTRRVIPNLLKLHLGLVYRLNDDVGNPNARFLDGLLRRRSLNMGTEPKIAGGLEGALPLGEDNKTNVFGAAINVEIPVSNINEFTAIGEPQSFARSVMPDRERLVIENHNQSSEGARFLETATRPDGGIPENLVTPLLRRNGQFSFFYTWWLETDGENPPDNIFRVDLGINYTEVQEVALLRNNAGNVYFGTANSVKPATRGGRGLLTYTPSNVLDWVYARFEYRNETTYPFGFYAQYSNQILMTGGYVPIFGNWMYLEAKVAAPLRERRPYEPEVYFMVSPVFRILIPR